MNKKEQFKIFASKHPELINQIKNKQTSWQELYEIYDIYGEDTTAWSPYISKEVKETTTTSTSLNDIGNIFKKADMGSIQKHIGTAQKAIGLFQEFVGKSTVAGAAGAALGSVAAKPSESRPVNKFFED